jgi:hypothetical protein
MFCPLQPWALLFGAWTERLGAGECKKSSSCTNMKAALRPLISNTMTAQKLMFTAVPDLIMQQSKTFVESNNACATLI